MIVMSDYSMPGYFREMDPLGKPISDKIKEWPEWVVDYVIAHEMTHRLHPDHSQEFWETLRQAYPKTEQARGFIKGVGFAKELDLIEED